MIRPVLEKGLSCILFNNPPTKWFENFFVKKFQSIQHAWQIQKHRLLFTVNIYRITFWNDRDGLKELAYNMLNKSPYATSAVSRHVKGSDHVALFILLFQDSTIAVSDLKSVLLKTLSALHSSNLANSSKKLTRSNSVQKATEPLSEKDLWPIATKQNPESMITLSHGGGYRYIQEFLAGKNQGYALERLGTGTGIQVHLIQSQEATQRSLHYSLQSLLFFDTPAIFTAKIKAKYLYAANNDYEAGLPPRSIRYLTDVKVETWDSNDSIIRKYESYINWDNVKNKYSQSQINRFKASIDGLIDKTK